MNNYFVLQSNGDVLSKTFFLWTKQAFNCLKPLTIQLWQLMIIFLEPPSRRSRRQCELNFALINFYYFLRRFDLVDFCDTTQKVFHGTAIKTKQLSVHLKLYLLWNFTEMVLSIYAVHCVHWTERSGNDEICLTWGTLLRAESSSHFLQQTNRPFHTSNGVKAGLWTYTFVYYFFSHKVQFAQTTQKINLSTT